MSLELVGLSRCSSCTESGLSWECPVCEAVLGEVSFDGQRDIVSVRGSKCGGCGEDREVVAYMIPEALTDFWMHEILAAERIRKVEFSEDTGWPTVLHFRGGLLQVEEMLFFVCVSDGGRSVGVVPCGAYVLRTVFGVCVVVSSPHDLGDGEVEEGIVDWHLVEVDDEMRQRLTQRSRMPNQAIREPASRVDDGLLRNSNAYVVVFRIENALRGFLEDRLRLKAGNVKKWWDAVVPSALRDEIEKVRERRQKSAWFEVPLVDQIALTTIGQLRVLLEGDWDRLGQGLGPKEVFLGALRKVEFCRNELAHFRPLTLRMLRELHEAERSLTRFKDLV